MPAKHEERYSKVSVIVHGWHRAHLEHLARDMAARSGTPISRSAIIRAIVEAAMVSVESVTECAQQSHARKQQRMIRHCGAQTNALQASK